MKNYSAKKREEILKIAEEIGIDKTADIYSISGRTILKWKKKYKEIGITGLKNISKKDKFHPNNKIDDEVLEKIIRLKKTNPAISAISIKKKLNLSTSLTLIYRKLKENDLVRKKSRGKKKKSSIFFKDIQLSIEKINFKKNSQNAIKKDFLEYKIIIKDVQSGISFIGFAYEKTEVNISIFTNYIFSKMKDIGFNLENSFLSVPKFLISSKNKSFLLENIATLYKVKIVPIVKKELNDFSFENELLKNNNDLIYKAYALSLLKNNILLKKDNPELSKEGKRVELLLHKAIPIISDIYLSNIKNIFLNNTNNNTKFQYLSDKNSGTILSDALKFLINKIESQMNKNQKFEESIEHYETVFNSYEYLNDFKRQIEIKIKIAEIKLPMGKTISAEKELSLSLALSTKYEIVDFLPKIYNMLGFRFMLDGEFKKASFYYDKHLKIALKTKNKAEIGIANLNFNLLFLSSGKNKKRLKVILEAIKIFKHLKNNYLHIFAITDLGIYYADTGDYFEAEKSLKEALELSYLHNISKELPRIHTNLGITFYRKNQYENSLEYYNLAMDEFFKRGNDLNASQVLNNIGIIHLENNSYDKALNSFNNLFKTADKLNNIKMKGVASGNIGLIYCEIEKLKIAEKTINKAISYAKKSNSKIDLIKYLHTKSEIKFKQNKLLDAKKINNINRLSAYRYGDNKHIFATELLGLKIDYKNIIIVINSYLDDIDNKVYQSKVRLFLRKFLSKIIVREKKQDSIAEVEYVATMYFEFYSILLNLHKYDFISKRKSFNLRVNKVNFDILNVDFFKEKLLSLYDKLFIKSGDENYLKQKLEVGKLEDKTF